MYDQNSKSKVVFRFLETILSGFHGEQNLLPSDWSQRERGERPRSLDWSYPINGTWLSEEDLSEEDFFYPLRKCIFETQCWSGYSYPAGNVAALFKDVIFQWCSHCCHPIIQRHFHLRNIWSVITEVLIHPRTKSLKPNQLKVKSSQLLLPFRMCVYHI